MRRARLGVVLVALLIAAPAGAVVIDWVPVGAPGNAADDTGFGAVAAPYRIARTEVTNAQYAEFLNAVADDDPNGLYDTASTAIQRSGSAGSYVYAVAPGRANRPVEIVSFYDTLRFANWLQNGQPTGPQGPLTTEAGAYTMTGPTSAGPRNAGASIFLPSEDEWYKAAYYDALGASYFEYPTSSEAPPACGPPPGTPPAASCGAEGDTSDVGSYLGSASPFGTFDQGGNVYEWTEGTDGPTRIARGGSRASAVSILAASSRFGLLPVQEQLLIGFRIASVPEPGSPVLLACGVGALAARRTARRRGRAG